MTNRIIPWIFWPTAVLLIAGTTSLLWYYSLPRRYQTQVHAAGVKQNGNPDEDGENDSPLPETTNVKVVHPRSGAMERLTTQVGSVEADEVHIHSLVSGILHSQSVLIGARVKKGHLLAVIEVPEIEKQMDRNLAVIEQAKARVGQMKAKVAIAKADLESAKAQIVYSQANARAATAWVGFRALQFQRMKSLFDKTSIEEKLVDEAKERYEAAKESEHAAKAAIATTTAQSMSADAKIQLADADVLEAEAQVKIARADFDKSKVQLDYAQITAPFDGIITQRTLYPGALVRAAGERGAQAPLLTIQRTDLMRVVVQIPDRDVPYADVDDLAYVEIDAFPGVKFDAKISRIAKTEDPQTRLMPIEIDLPNPQGKIRQGMFGKVTIILDKATDQLSIPSSCLVGKSKTREGTVFVESDGKVHRAKVKLGMDNGERVEVLHGLKKSDRIILSPPTGLTDGLEVQAILLEETELKGDPMP